jgi:fatty-acid desaturase
MSYLMRTLQVPSYGFTTVDGLFYKPTRKELFKEFFSRINPIADRRNWIAFVGWVFSLALAVPFFIFLFKYFSWKLALLGLTYSMVGMGTYGTVWFHRYATHRSFKFRNNIWRFFFRNIVIKILPEEIYVVSHHVHHANSEKPGDPYNVYGGWLYCFLADAIHQPIAKNLTESEYSKVCLLLKETGVIVNSYPQYLKWGSLCHPALTVIHYILNWSFWFGVFYFIGGFPLATAIFGMAVIWSMGVRTFNYDGHGRGIDQRQKGVDFNVDDISINQLWPGYVAGEWHNNHHLFPQSARSGFLFYQIDSAWIVIRFLSLIGGVVSYRDSKEDFFQKFYNPYLKSLKEHES